MDFEALEYDLLATVDENKFGSEEFRERVKDLTLDGMTSSVRKYFPGDVRIQEAIVTAR